MKKWVWMSSLRSWLSFLWMQDGIITIMYKKSYSLIFKHIIIYQPHEIMFAVTYFHYIDGEPHSQKHFKTKSGIKPSFQSRRITFFASHQIYNSHKRRSRFLKYNSKINLLKDWLYDSKIAKRISKIFDSINIWGFCMFCKSLFLRWWARESHYAS